MSAAKLLYSHDDIITSITASTVHTSRFITTSLDGQIKLFDILSCTVLQEIDTVPVLNSVFNKHHFYVSCVDGTIRAVDFESGNANPIGAAHVKGANCILAGGDVIISGSWDKTVQVLRLESLKSEFIELPEKILAMDLRENVLVVAMANRLVYVYDMSNLAKPLQIRESGLKYQIRSVSCFEDGFAASSIEGKVALEYYDNLNNYAFRCHRSKDIVNSVNHCQAIDNKILLTAADDGNVIEWDFQLRKKLKGYYFGNHKISCFLIANSTKLIVVTDKEVYAKDLLG